MNGKKPEEYVKFFLRNTVLRKVFSRRKHYQGYLLIIKISPINTAVFKVSNRNKQL